MRLDRGYMDKSGMDRSFEYTPAAMRYYSNEFTFLGDCIPGQQIIIDGENYTVTNGATNAIHQFNGDFPELFPGENTITYSDNGANRYVLLQVNRSERHI